MIQCKFRVKIISVIFKIHVCLHCAMSWPVSSFCHGRREWVGLVCCHFYFQHSPLQKILALKAVFVKRGLPIQRLTVENSPSIPDRTRLYIKVRDKSNVQHQKRPSPVLSYLIPLFLHTIRKKCRISE